MRPPARRRSVPVWLCTWRDGRAYRTRYVALARPRRLSQSDRPFDFVRRHCERHGLGEPLDVRYAGFNAYPDDVGGDRRKRGASARRVPVTLALHLYAMLRVDWPIGSLLSNRAARQVYTDKALRDFIANVGAAIERLPRQKRRAVEQQVEAEARAWANGALERNAHTAGACRTEATHRRRRENATHRARRLAKRVDFARGVDLLEAALCGALPDQVEAVDNLAEILTHEGVPQEEAAELAERWRGVMVPRF